MKKFCFKDLFFVIWLTACTIWITRTEYFLSLPEKEQDVLLMQRNNFLIRVTPDFMKDEQ